MRNIPLIKLTFFMWKTLQTFSTIIYSYSLLAVCSTHGSCVVVLPYYWHNIAVDVFEMKTAFLLQIIIKVHFLCDQTYFFRFMFGHFNLIHYFWGVNSYLYVR